MIHEWLWDFTKNVRTIRKLNWFLHSKSLSDVTKEEFSELLSRIDLFDRVLPACYRSRAIKRHLEKDFNKSCDQITLEEINFLEELTIIPMKNEIYRSGDFSEFYGIAKLQISDSELYFKSIPTKEFGALFSLETLTLNNLNLKTINSDLFNNLKYLKYLDIKGNPLVKIFSGLGKLNELEEIKITFNKNLERNVKTFSRLPRQLKRVIIYGAVSKETRVKIKENLPKYSKTTVIYK